MIARRMTNRLAWALYRERRLANNLLRDVLYQLEPARFNAGEWNDTTRDFPPEVLTFLEQEKARRDAATTARQALQ